ncbi:hypothetical protein [Cyclobacterium sp.]|uniref:hypothetical protein n=1 Tax=Cyclobacterium sp. TaxID=1966343 RepID=UPI0019AE5A2B|nr:hypothetical protein [Cyclobacterium sp.]MBD3628042.1 hypothetical protein [Cyclobacterium sp.]
MLKSLYLVCPVNQLEAFIQNKFGTHHFFLTALGTVFRFEEVRYVEKVTDFLMQDSIDRITLVHDLNCPFKNRIINHEKGLHSYAEEYLFEMYIDHYYRINQFQSREEKARELSMIHSENLIHTISNHPLLEKPLRQKGIALDSLLVDWKTNQLEKVEESLFLEKIPAE